MHFIRRAFPWARPRSTVTSDRENAGPKSIRSGAMRSSLSTCRTIGAGSAICPNSTTRAYTWSSSHKPSPGAKKERRCSSKVALCAERWSRRSLGAGRSQGMLCSRKLAAIGSRRVRAWCWSTAAPSSVTVRSTSQAPCSANPVWSIVAGWVVGYIADQQRPHALCWNTQCIPYARWFLILGLWYGLLTGIALLIVVWSPQKRDAFVSTQL